MHKKRLYCSRNFCTIPISCRFSLAQPRLLAGSRQSPSSKPQGGGTKNFRDSIKIWAFVSIHLLASRSHFIPTSLCGQKALC